MQIFLPDYPCAPTLQSESPSSCHCHGRTRLKSLNMTLDHRPCSRSRRYGLLWSCVGSKATVHATSRSLTKSITGYVCPRILALFLGPGHGSSAQGSRTFNISHPAPFKTRSSFPCHRPRYVYKQHRQCAHLVEGTKADLIDNNNNMRARLGWLALWRGRGEVGGAHPRYYADAVHSLLKLYASFHGFLASFLNFLAWPFAGGASLSYTTVHPTTLNDLHQYAPHPPFVPPPLLLVRRSTVPRRQCVTHFHSFVQAGWLGKNQRATRRESI